MELTETRVLCRSIQFQKDIVGNCHEFDVSAFGGWFVELCGNPSTTTRKHHSHNNNTQ
jgi:hypothetical protein